MEDAEDDEEYNENTVGLITVLLDQLKNCFIRCCCRVIFIYKRYKCLKLSWTLASKVKAYPDCIVVNTDVYPSHLDSGVSKS